MKTIDTACLQEFLYNKQWKEHPLETPETGNGLFQMMRMDKSTSQKMLNEDSKEKPKLQKQLIQDTERRRKKGKNANDNTEQWIFDNRYASL